MRSFPADILVTAACSLSPTFASDRALRGCPWTIRFADRWRYSYRAAVTLQLNKVAKMKTQRSGSFLRITRRSYLT